MFCGKPMNIFECERYLGDFISSSLQESVFQTIQRRRGLVLKLINEIRVTIKDCRSNSLGGLLVGLEIWRKAVIPYLFNNSATWMEIPKKAHNLLNSITSSFFRALFTAAKGTPLTMYYWDTKSLLIENFLMMKKLLLYHHLENLPQTALAKEVLSLQKEIKSKDSCVT